VGLGLLAFGAGSAPPDKLDQHDVGNPTLKGSVTDNGDGTMTIVGGGDDIWNNADNCHFLYAWASGQTWT